MRLASVDCVHARMVCCNSQVRYTGAREKSPEERRERFVEDLKQGHSVIVSSRPSDCRRS